MGKMWETSNTDMSNKICAEFVRYCPHKTYHVELNPKFQEKLSIMTTNHLEATIKVKLQLLL